MKYLLALLITIFLIPITAAEASYDYPVNEIADDSLRHASPEVVTFDNEGRRIEIWYHDNQQEIVRIEPNGQRTVLVTAQQLGNALPVTGLRFHESAVYIIHGNRLSVWHTDGRFHTIFDSIPTYDNNYTHHMTWRNKDVYIITVYVEKPWYTQWSDANYNIPPAHYASCRNIDFYNYRYTTDTPVLVPIGSSFYGYNSPTCYGSVTRYPSDTAESYNTPTDAYSPCTAQTLETSACRQWLFPG